MRAVLGDFDDGSLESSWGGTWTARDDSVAPGGTSTSSVEIVDGALVIEGELRPGFAMGPFAGASVVWSPAHDQPVDVTNYDALRLRVRGNAAMATVSLQSSRVRGWDQFTATLLVTDEWTDVTIPFTDFRQMGFGKRLDWTGDDLIGLSIDVRTSPFGGGKMGAFRVEIEDVHLDG